MYDFEIWIKDGSICPRPTRADGAAISDRRLLHEFNFVKLESGQAGTRVHWVMFGANWSSLIFMNDFITTCTAPVTLRYFNAGWFEETLESAVDARSRLDVLLSKSDVRFNERTYVVPFETDVKKLPNRLRQALEDASAVDSLAVTCTVDTEREVIKVDQVGQDSALGRIWGVSPVSFPCQTGHSYDRVVSRHYYHVLHTGKPHYGHVLAAMVWPDGEVGWIGYQRLIIPESKVVNGLGRVKVVSELGPVDIKLL